MLNHCNFTVRICLCDIYLTSTNYNFFERCYCIVTLYSEHWCLCQQCILTTLAYVTNMGCIIHTVQSVPLSLQSGLHLKGQSRYSVCVFHCVFWQHSIVVRTLISAGELSLSCTRLLAGWVTTLWLNRPLSVSQQGQLSHPSLRGW